MTEWHWDHWVLSQRSVAPESGSPGAHQRYWSLWMWHMWHKLG